MDAAVAERWSGLPWCACDAQRSVLFCNGFIASKSASPFQSGHCLSNFAGSERTKVPSFPDNRLDGLTAGTVTRNKQPRSADAPSVCGDNTCASARGV